MSQTKPRRARGQGSVFQKPGSRTWTIQYYREGFKEGADGKLLLDAAGRPIRARIRVREATGSTNHRRAQDLLTQRMGEAGRSEWKPVEKHPLTVLEVLDALRLHNTVHKPSMLANDRKSCAHLVPALGVLVATQLTADHLTAYAARRQKQAAKNATINRELATLRHAFRLAVKHGKLKTLPYVTMLVEDNARTGFVEDPAFARLVAEAGELWLRTFLELAYTYGWRKGELLSLRVRQVDLRLRTVRLDPGTTKNRKGREVTMTAKVAELLRLAVAGKKPEDFVLTRKDGKPVRSFRGAWQDLCVRAGEGQFVCRACERPATKRKRCECGARERKYRGLIPHDLRRSAAKAMRRAGVPESVAMKIGGWITPSVFDRYAIVNDTDNRDAAEKIEKSRAAENSPRLASISPESPATPTGRVQ